MYHVDAIHYLRYRSALAHSWSPLDGGSRHGLVLSLNISQSDSALVQALLLTADGVMFF